jgi:hypothetical protein
MWQLQQTEAGEEGTGDSASGRSLGPATEVGALLSGMAITGASDSETPVPP